MATSTIKMNGRKSTLIQGRPLLYSCSMALLYIAIFILVTWTKVLVPLVYYDDMLTQM